MTAVIFSMCVVLVAVKPTEPGAHTIASVGFSLANENFYSLTNVGILLRSIAVLFLLSMGMTFVMLTGGIDLSVGSNVAFAGGVGVIALTTTNSATVGFAAAILAGMVIGHLAPKPLK